MTDDKQELQNLIDDRTKIFALKILDQFCKTLPQTEEEIFQKYGQSGIDILNSVRLRRFPIIDPNSIWDHLSKKAQQDLDDKTLEDLDKIINEIALNGKK